MLYLVYMVARNFPTGRSNQKIAHVNERHVQDVKKQLAHMNITRE
jgi:hypothetical protein